MDADLLATTIGGLFRLSNVVASWLLTYLLHSTTWILVAWFLASRRSLRREPGAQHVVWGASLTAGFVTATLHLTGAIEPLTGNLRVAERLRQTVAAVVVKEGGAPGRAPMVRLTTLLSPPHERMSAPVAGDRIHRLDAGEPWERAAFALLDGVPPSSGTTNIAPLPPDVRAAMHTVAQRAPHPGAGAGERTFQRTMVLAPPPSIFAIVPWFLVAAALLARLAWSRRRLRQSLGDRREGGALPAGVALRHLRHAGGVHRDVSLVITDAVAAPAAVSTHEIALPSRLLAELTPLEQEGVLAHELAHVVRRDTLWLRLALIMECIAWFQPLNRLARRRMQLAAEFAADAWAVRVTREPLGLARALARIAEWVVAPLPAGHHGPMRAVLGADGSPLLQRVVRLTAPQEQDPFVSGRRRSVTLLAIAAVAALLVTLPSIAVGGAKQARSLVAREEVRILVRFADRAPPSAPDGAPVAALQLRRNN